MNLSFIALAAMILLSAVAAMSLRNLVHCALAVAGSFAGLAAVYLQLGAQFIGLAQVLVYIGAVAILILFAILLTRGLEPEPDRRFSPTWVYGAVVAAAVFSVLASVFLATKSLPSDRAAAPATVRGIGDQLMTVYALPLQVVGLLLTAALIGAVILAIQERGAPPPSPPPGGGR